MNRAVLVPIDVEALVLDAPLAPPRHDGAPFSTADATLPPGVHLSWAMPDGLTRADSTSDGRLVFPTLPDRWLVARFGADSLPDGRRAATAFLVDAWNESLAPLSAASSAPAPSPSDRARLTAAGVLEGGELNPASAPDGWNLAAGYYPAVRRRFGFHDTPDLTQGPVSYVVIGWYGSENEDPALTAGLDVLLARAAVRVEGAVALPPWTPRVDPAAPVRPPPVKLRRPRAERSFAGGETALLRDSADLPQDLASQRGALLERLRADDASFLAELPERARRDPSSGALASRHEESAEKSLAKAAAAGVQLVGIPLVSHASPLTPPPAEVGLVCHGAIFDVGQAGFGQKAWLQHQKASGDAKASQASLHESLGDALDAALSGAVAKESRDFLRALLAGQGTKLLQGGTERAAADAIYDAAFLGAPSPSVTAWTAIVRDAGDPKIKPTLPDPAAGVTMFVRDLRTLAGPALPTGVDASDLPKLRADAGPSAVVSVASFGDPPPRWYEPASPTVLVVNAGRTYRFGFDERFGTDGYLGARSASDLVGAQTISIAGGPARIVDAGELVDLASLPAWLPAPVVALVREAALVDPLSHPRADALASVPGAAASDAVSRSFGSATLPTSFAVRRFREPFVPLFVEARYQVTTVDGATLTGQERALLGPASETLAGSLSSLAKSVGAGPDSAGLTQAAEAVGKLDLLTAALPSVGQRLAEAGHVIRDGTLSVTELRVVDIFGQARVVTPSSGAAKTTLPRAFALPARLACRFVDAAVEIDAAAADAGPTVSPVVGFLRTDPIEQAIEVYDHDGHPLGQLRHEKLSPSAGAPSARVVAEGPVGSAATLASNLSKARPALAQIVSALGSFAVAPTDQDTSVSAFTRVVDVTRFVVDGATSSSYREAILGRPIVLLRVHLDLERGTAGPTGTTKAPPGVVKLQAKVSLGCLSRTDDGLLGYWIGTRSGGATEWSAFRTVQPPLTRLEEWPQSLVGGDTREAVTSLLDIRSGYIEVVTDASRLDVLEGAGAELVVALDGRLGFSVACDELPTKHLRPLEAFGGATLKKLAPSFAVGPVLVDPTAFALPAPALEAEHPTWVRKSAPGAREVLLEGYPEARLSLPNKRMRVEEEGAIRLDPGVDGAPPEA